MEIGVSVHTVVLRLPDNGRNLVAPGCVECRALPHFAHSCAPEVRDYWRRGLRIPRRNCPRWLGSRLLADHSAGAQVTGQQTEEIRLGGVTLGESSPCISST